MYAELAFIYGHILPNWLLNMEVVCFGRAYRERTLMKSRASVSQEYLHMSLLQVIDN